jgi:gliding motility-associated-like protein
MVRPLRLFTLLVLFLWFSKEIGAQITILHPQTGLPTTSYALTESVCRGSSVEHCITVQNPGTTAPVISSFTTGGGTIVIAPPTQPSPLCFRFTAGFSQLGNNVITLNITNNLGQTAQVTITVTVVNQNTPIDAGPNQSLCWPANTTTLTAVNPDPLVTGYWSTFVGPGEITGGFDSPHVSGVDQRGGATVTVSNLQLGNNMFRWNQVYPCGATTFDLVTIYVYNGTPPVADANTCFPSVGNHSTKTVTLCGSTSYTLCAVAPGTAATGTWNILSGCGTIYNINNATADITNLCAGCNSLEWSISNGTCPGGDTRDTVTICVYPTIQQATTVGSVSRCLGSAGAYLLTGNAPTGANTGQWTFVNGPATPHIVNPNAFTTNVQGITQPGTYQFNWTITSGPCGSSTATMYIYVYSSSAAVDAGSDIEVCLPSNSVALAATTPTAPATGMWTVVQGTGSFASVSNPQTTVSGLSVGVNKFRWTVANGPCANNNTFDEVNVIVYPASQAAANAGSDINLTANGATVSTTLNATAATAPGQGTWTVTGPTVPAFSPNANAQNATVSNLAPGIYTFTWTVTNGSCSAPTSDQMLVTVFDCTQTQTSAGPNQNLCSPASSVTMAATAAPVPATGTWTVLQGGGSIADIHHPATTVTNLPIGVNVFRWTIQNGSCSSFHSDVTINVFDNSVTNAEAGTLQEHCVDGGPLLITLGATAPVAPATGTWSGPGSIANIHDAATTVVNLPVGINTFTWTINNGPCGTTSDQVNINIFSPGQTQANAGTDQQLCVTANNTSVVGNSLISPATGTWSIVSGGGVITSPNSQATTITNIPVGQNIYRWTIDNGPCTTPVQSTDDVMIEVFSNLQPAANAGPDQSVCSSVATIALAGNNVIVPAVGTWTVSPAGPVFANSHSPSTTVSSLTPGTVYTFTWTINNGTCGTTADQMVLNYYNENQAVANAGTDISICLPTNSVQLSANEADSPATGSWTFISGPATPSFTANNHATMLSNLVAGTYTMSWTINNGVCSGAVSSDEVTIKVYSNTQAPANAGADQQICLPVNFTTLTGNAPIAPAVGTCTQVSGPSTATINNANLSTVNVSNLQVGCYVFRWTINNGVCSGSVTSDEVTVCVFSNAQTVANAGPDVNVCTPATSVQLQANSIIAPAVGTWTVINAPNAPTFTPNANTPNATLGNLVVGTYELRWSVSNGSCNNANTNDIVVIKVFDSTAPIASAGSMEELCSPSHTVVMAANAAIAPAVGTWTLISGNGSITSIHDAQTSVTNIPVGINCFRWTIDNGGCGAATTSSDVCVNVYSSNQTVANAGADIDICTPLDAVTMTANAVTIPAVGQWQQISGPNTANIVSPNAPNTSINELMIGCYEFRWTINNGSCSNPISSDIVEVCVYPGGAPAAFAGDDIELCSPLNSTVMAAEAAIVPGEGTWTLVSGPNTPTFDVNDNATSVAGLIPGVYVFDWALNYSSCGSESDQVTITVFNSAQGAAVAGVDQALCTPTSSTTLNAQPVLAPGYGTWSLLSGDVDFVDIHDATTTAYNIPAGIHTLVWTVYNGDCLADEFTTDTMVIVINDNAQLPAVVGSDISICTPQSSVTLQGSALLIPAVGTWSTTSNAAIQQPNASTTIVSDLEVGVHEFCWTIENGMCANSVTSDCLEIFVYDAAQEQANAGADQELCAVGNTCATMAANSVITPGFGTWTQIDGQTTATIADIHSPTTTMCNLVPGVYVFQWCIDNGPCGSITCDQVTVTVYPSDTPPAAAGADLSICTPQVTVTMNASMTQHPAYGEWQLISGTGTIFDNDNPQTLIHSLAVGENKFAWCVFNGVCPNSQTCDTVSVFVYNSNAPVAYAGQDQDVCSTTSTITMEASAVIFPGVGTWTALGNYASAIDDVHNPQTTLNGLAVGEYEFVWTVDNGPCASAITSDVVRIRIYDANQTQAFAGGDIEICTPQSMVTMNANAVTFPATGSWQILPQASGAIAAINNPSTQITGLTPGVSKYVWTIDNGPCANAITTDTISIYVFDANVPPANAGVDQHFCAPTDLSTIGTVLNGSIVVGAGVGTWTQVSGPNTATFTNEHSNASEAIGLTVGQYIFKWSVQNGPCGVTEDEMSIYINDPNVPPAEAGPDMDYCTPVDMHQLAATPVAFPAQGTWMAFPPVPIGPDMHDANAVATNLSVGYQLFMWSVDNGACPESSDFVQIRIYDEFQPSANAGLDIELCLPTTQVFLESTDIYAPAIGIWSKVSGCSSASIADVNNPNTLVSNLCVGTQCFQWMVDNGPCPNGNTRDTVCVRVYDPTVVVEVSDNQSICTPESSVTISGTVPQDPNTGTWTVIQGGGTIAEPTNPTTDINDLPVGINVFRWQFYNGICDNQPFDEVTINVYDQTHPWANAGEDVEMCYPTNNTTLTGNTPITPAIGYWTLVSGSGNIASPNSAVTDITDLAVGVNEFVWTIQNGPCSDSVMTDTVRVHVFPENPQVAVGGPDLEICTPDNSVTLQAITPDLPSVGVWEVIDLNGQITDVNSATSTVEFLTAGTHVLRWVIDNGPCNADDADTLSIFVYNQTAQDAEVGEDIELCAPLSETNITANEAVSPGIGSWSVLSSTSGTPQITDPSSAQTTVTNLSVGVTELVWTIDNGTCGISLDTLRITVFDPTSPSASVQEDEMLCDAPKCVELIGTTPTFPAYGWWTQIAGDNTATIEDESASTTSACGLALNETAFVWNVYNGTCSNGNTTDTLWFYIYDSQVAVANAGGDAAYCDPGTVDHQLIGSAVSGTIAGLAVGTWTGPAGEIELPNSSSTMINDLPPGVHCFTWTVDNGACGVTSDEVCITVYNQNQTPAYAGADVEICANEFIPFYLNGNEPEAPATGQWTVLQGPAELQGMENNDAFVSSLGEIITELVDVYSVLAWTIDNGMCGSTSDTVTFILQDCETLKIPDAFSPNGDGTNDVFYIPNLEYYPNNRLQIFNRWGALVYEGAPYKNDWDGRSTHSATIGEELPVSAYYYVLSLGQSYDEVPDKVFTGYIYLKR